MVVKRESGRWVGRWVGGSKERVWVGRWVSGWGIGKVGREVRLGRVER